MNSRRAYSVGPEGATSFTKDRCRRCDKTPCACEPVTSVPPESQRVRVQRETGGRKGKTVTVSKPFVLTRSDAKGLLKALKQRCGAGGALKLAESADGPAFAIEIQGDHADAIVDELVLRKYPAKRSGG